MIEYEEYIWGDKFKNYFSNFNIYSDIDHVLKHTESKEKIIITHNGDNGATEEILNKFKNIKIWFAQNVLTNNKKIIPIPIGLENDYIKGQPERKNILYNKSKNNKIPKKLIYLNFNIGTYRQDRECAYNYFCNKNWSTSKKHGSVNYSIYCDDILDHYFVVCPRGNGLDCHRNWEVLYLNRYPIMKKYYGLEKLYENLPVLFVDNWYNIDEIFLNDALNKIKNTKYDYEKLKFSYWKNIIMNKLKELQ
jgi:hypothetical protein